MQEQSPKKRGFAAISPERMREIASAGGIARKRAYDASRGQRKNVDEARVQANPPGQNESESSEAAGPGSPADYRATGA